MDMDMDVDMVHGREGFGRIGNHGFGSPKKGTGRKPTVVKGHPPIQES